MSAEGFPDSTEAVLGAELCRYRRRPERDIVRDTGLNPWIYYLSPVLLLMAAFFLSAPPILLAKRMGAPDIRDPFWGPIVIAWFVMCCGLLSIFMYVLPRRDHLAIHEKGFIYRSRLRRYAVRFDEIAQCVVAPKSRGLTLVLRNSKRLWFKGFMILFPEEGVVQLLERVDQQAGAGELQVTQVDSDMKAQLRRAGWAVGLLIYVILVIIPIGSAESRRVTLKACGETVWGVPYYVFVPLLCAIAFAPFVYVMNQLMVLTTSRLRLQTASGLYDARELRKAWVAVIFGGIYVVVLVGLWIAYTSALGI